MSNYLLRLFVSGSTPRSRKAIESLEAICAKDLNGHYRLEVIDVLEDPAAAIIAEVSATPTVLKQLPPPLRQLIGDLSDQDRVLKGLDLLPPGAPSEGG